MKWLRTIYREILGLFVDDAAFALAILIWLGLVKILMILMPHLGIPAPWIGIVLFSGLALILAESTIRYAKRPQTKRDQQ
jgi:membrane protein implicated in regulation of membrane protease activity